MGLSLSVLLSAIETLSSLSVDNFGSFECVVCNEKSGEKTFCDVVRGVETSGGDGGDRYVEFIYVPYFYSLIVRVSPTLLELGESLRSGSEAVHLGLARLGRALGVVDICSTIWANIAISLDLAEELLRGNYLEDCDVLRSLVESFDRRFGKLVSSLVEMLPIERVYISIMSSTTKTRYNFVLVDRDAVRYVEAVKSIAKRLVELDEDNRYDRPVRNLTTIYLHFIDSKLLDSTIPIRCWLELDIAGSYGKRRVSEVDILLNSERRTARLEVVFTLPIPEIFSIRLLMRRKEEGRRRRRLSEQTLRSLERIGKKNIFTRLCTLYPKLRPLLYLLDDSLFRKRSSIVNIPTNLVDEVKRVLNIEKMERLSIWLRSYDQVLPSVDLVEILPLDYNRVKMRLEKVLEEDRRLPPEIENDVEKLVEAVEEVTGEKPIKFWNVGNWAEEVLTLLNSNSMITMRLHYYDDDDRRELWELYITLPREVKNQDLYRHILLTKLIDKTARGYIDSKRFRNINQLKTVEIRGENTTTTIYIPKP